VAVKETSQSEDCRQDSPTLPPASTNQRVDRANHPQDESTNIIIIQQQQLKKCLLQAQLI
jgi:hypothetical protein